VGVHSENHNRQTTLAPQHCFLHPINAISGSVIIELACKRRLVITHKQNMSTEKSPLLKQTSTAVASSCQKKSESATFFEECADHIDEFIHASMDEHTQAQETIQKC
ncbi:hypothetical protein HAX54_038916, partial [Datura stramonium]|nr:hypothetical protein [Datura stramonium]